MSARQRPGHPDFHALAKIVRERDERAEAAQGSGFIPGELRGADVNVDVCAYVAEQRAMRAIGFGQLAGISPMYVVEAVWVEGFITGYDWSELRKRERDSSTARLVGAAASLLDPGEEEANPEYFRALIEVVCRFEGKITDDHRDEVADRIKSAIR